MRAYHHLHINLTTGASTYTDCTNLFMQWLGGTGVATRLFADYCQNAGHPLDPDSPIILAVGPLNILFPVMTKTVALFHSPLTGNLGESHAGGRLSLSMVESQNHIITITGKAPSLSYLVIENQKVSLIKANSLEHFSASATERVLRNREKGVGKRSILRIGPAGERMSPIAGVTVDASRHFGRLGLGAVWGSKNLKAIVISGDKSVPMPEKQGYKKEYFQLFQTITCSTAMKKYHDLGTAMNVLPLNQSGALPTRNFSQGFFEGSTLISGEAFADTDLIQQISCAGCPIGCIHLATHREVFDPQNHMVKSFKVAYDYELIFALGSNLSISSRSQILQLIQEIERQGWDAISIGGVLAWAVEAFQQGFISKKESMDEVLRFGDGALFLRMLKNISSKANSFYVDLEKGSIYCSKKYGGSNATVSFGQTEAAGYLTGLFFFLGLAIGIRHSHLDAAGYDIDLHSDRNKTPLKKLESLYQEALWRMIFNSLVGCLFSRKVYSPEQTVRCLNLIGQNHINLASLSLLSHQIHGLKYHCKQSLGFQWEDLTLPAKLNGYPSLSGKITAEDFDKYIQIYREWTAKDIASAQTCI